MEQLSKKKKVDPYFFFFSKTSQELSQISKHLLKTVNLKSEDTLSKKGGGPSNKGIKRVQCLLSISFYRGIFCNMLQKQTC